MAKKGGAPTKSEIVATICKDSELSRKQVAAVFESLNGIIKKSLRGAGMFTLPGLLKMKVVKKPATKARQGINPFTKEAMTFKAKPASKKIRRGPSDVNRSGSCAAVNALVSRELRMEAGPDLEQAADPPMERDPALGRRGDAGEHLLEVLRRIPSRPYTGDERALALEP